MTAPTPRRYVLGTYRVECTNRGWVYCPFGHEHEKQAWSRPYSSLTSLTLMIARQLRREVARRDAVLHPSDTDGAQVR